jgi:hypothetical protein
MTGVSWAVVRVTPDRLGRRRLAYFAGVNLTGGVCWSRSLRPTVLVGTQQDAGAWIAVVRHATKDERVSLCQLGDVS